eukprot:gene12702-14006_t
MASPSREGKAPTSMLQLAVQSALPTVLAHPLTYVKVLVEVGYDPLPPKRGKTLFGKDVLYLTGFIDYAKHIKETDGFAGLYRGLLPRFLHNVINSAVTNLVNSTFKVAAEEKGVGAQLLEGIDENDADKESKPMKTSKEFFVETCQLSVGKAAGVIVSYPFHLICIRTMVQFIGKETYYNNIFSSMSEVYQEEGILGFFAGLIPQLTGEMLSFWIFRTLSYGINRILHDQDEPAQTTFLVQGISQYISALATFPFILVTNIMAINNTRLAAGNPPNMPVFSNWIGCWAYLQKEKLLRRGDSILRRTVAIKSL